MNIYAWFHNILYKYDQSYIYIYIISEEENHTYWDVKCAMVETWVDFSYIFLDGHQWNDQDFCSH